MPDPGVSLIPRGSKSTKKRRTSFRPASKKSNQNKSKAATASSAKATKASISKKAEEPSSTTTISTKDVVVAASKLPVPADPALATEAASASAQSNDGASQPLSPAAKSSTSQLHSEEKGVSPRTTRASAAAATTTKTTPRKRKAHSLNKKISIGSSLRRKTDADDAASPGKNDANSPEKSSESTTFVLERTKSKDDGEGKENNVSALVEGKKHALTATFAMGTSIVPALSEHDQAILNQLANEESNEKDGVVAKALNAFCTPFKGPKRKLKDKKEGGKKDSTKGGGKKDSSANPNPSKVDATTNGAPSVQIVDGQIVLQESSVMLPSRRTIQEVEEELQDNVVEEDEQLNIVQASYTSFVTKGDTGKTRKKGSWTLEETEKFYYALAQLGCDFGSMEALFFQDQRTRKQLKNKYRKELAKNPDLVQELALNPKYHAELDMAALKIEVDPKRIEAHENEEPPAYEPTDGDEIEKTSSSKNNDAMENNDNQKDYNGVFEDEVVEEDAEEERLAEARAKQAEKNSKNNKASSKTATSSSETKKHKKESSLWSSGEVRKESEFGEGAADTGMDGFPPQRDDGPSMDDFFGDSYGDDDPMGEAETGNTTTDASSTQKEEAPVSSPPVPAPQKSRKKDTSEKVSLVPKKTNSRSRSRPKIRPSRRKK